MNATFANFVVSCIITTVKVSPPPAISSANTNTSTLEIAGWTVTILSAIASLLVQHVLQTRRDKVTHQRVLEDAQRERLREAGETMLLAVNESLHWIQASRIQLGDSEEDRKQADAIFFPILYGRVDLDKATVVFQSSGCEDVVEAFKAVHDATEVFYRSREWNGTGTERETSWKNINCLANDFKDTVSHHLEIILVQSIRSGLLSRLRGVVRVRKSSEDSKGR